VQIAPMPYSQSPSEAHVNSTFVRQGRLFVSSKVTVLASNDRESLAIADKLACKFVMPSAAGILRSAKSLVN